MIQDITLAVLVLLAYSWVVAFLYFRLFPDFRTMLKLRRQRRRGIRRGMREEETETQRLGRRVKALDKLAKQVEKNLREKQSREALEERRQLPITNYAERVADEALYAPNLGHVDDVHVPVVGDEVSDVYRGREAR